MVGLKSHRIRYRSGNRPVFITGIGVVGPKLVAPNSLNLRIKECWADYHLSETEEERDSVTQSLLSHLGTLKHISGHESEIGRKASDQMNSLRQKRDKRYRIAYEFSKKEQEIKMDFDTSDPADLPF